MMTARHAITCLHEASHAAAGLAIGCEVVSVSRADLPGEHGATILRCSNDLDAQTILLAPIVDLQDMTGYDPVGFRDDARKALAIGDVGLAVDRLRGLTLGSDYRRARRIIDRALWTRTQLTAADVRRLTG